MFIQERPPLFFDLAILNTDQAFFWENQWFPFTGTTLADFTLDVRNLQLGTSAAVSLKPALQFAGTRVERPDDGALISAGSAATGNGLTHWQETPSGGSKHFFRRGLGYRLTAGNFARVQGKLDTSWRQAARIFSPEEIFFNPTNSTTDWSIFPFAGLKPVPALGVDKLKYAVLGMGNANSTLEWQPVVRLYNDPQARGDWSAIGSVSNPSSGDFEVNTGEVAFTGLTLSNFQWLDLGLQVRKSSGGASNSRCQLRVLPALKLT